MISVLKLLLAILSCRQYNLHASDDDDKKAKSATSVMEIVVKTWSKLSQVQQTGLKRIKVRFRKGTDVFVVSKSQPGGKLTKPRANLRSIHTFCIHYWLPARPQERYRIVGREWKENGPFNTVKASPDANTRDLKITSMRLIPSKRFCLGSPKNATEFRWYHHCCFEHIRLTLGFKQWRTLIYASKKWFGHFQSVPN